MAPCLIYPSKSPMYLYDVVLLMSQTQVNSLVRVVHGKRILLWGVPTEPGNQAPCFYLSI